MFTASSSGTLATPRPAPRASLVSLDGAHEYPLERAHLRARTEGGMVLSTLHQHFRNPHPEALEVLYTLPLPADGAVLGYRITFGEQRIVGEIRSREDAREAYRTALYAGRTAGLLEQDRADTFQQQLGNLPAETAVEVEIDVLHPLAFRPAGDSGPAEWEYRFPTTVGIRYMGAPGRVPDAGRLDPDRAEDGVPARLTLSLEVTGAAPGARFRAPSHAIEVSPTDVSPESAPGPRDGGGSPVRSIGFREPSPLDRDVVIRWGALTPEVGVHVAEGGGLEGDEGRYALLTVLPPADRGAAHARDVTILLDTSGSMHGSPLAIAKTVVATLLESLDPGDRFELLSFGSRVERLTSGMVQATETELAEARRRLAALPASGATEMRRAVRQALRPLRADAQRQVVLVTDGYIGFEAEVVAELMESLSDGVRFHAVGVGSAPNRTLTGGLARAGRGVERFALDEASATEAGTFLARATARPILTDLVLSGPALRAQAPARPRDVLEGEPLTLTAELAPTGGALVLSGRLAGRDTPWRWEGTLSATPVAGASSPFPVGALHGRERISDLELLEAAGTPRSKIDPRIEETALRHRIVSRRTSLVAMSETPTVDPREPRRRERLAVEVPAGVSAEMAGLGGMGEHVDACRSVAPERMAFDRSIADREFHNYQLERADLDLDDFGGAGAGEFPFAEERIAEFRRPSRGPESRRPSRPPRTPRSRGDRESPLGSHADREPPTEPRELEDAEILLVEGDQLVVEFAVPHEGFRLPTGPLRLTLAGGGTGFVQVIQEDSSRSGPHPAGVRVRLALRFYGGRAWAAAGPVRIHWTRSGGAPGSAVTRRRTSSAHPPAAYTLSIDPTEGPG